MNTRILAAFATLALATPTSALAAWGDHLDTGADWIRDIRPAHNAYASPSVVEYLGGTLEVSAVCGGFVSELLKATYPDLTDDVMSALADDDPSDEHDWNSPDSQHWFDAIDDETSTTSDGLTFAFEKLTDIDDVEAGDILVSTYTPAGTTATGHTMVIYTMPTTFSLVTTTIPGYSGVSVERYRITVLDSTERVHLDRSDSTDSRYKAEVSPTDPTKRVNDEGMGTGEIYLYADHSTGALIGWTWTVVQSTAYQSVDAAGSNYRPVRVGRLSGTGI